MSATGAIWAGVAFSVLASVIVGICLAVIERNRLRRQELLEAVADAWRDRSESPRGLRQIVIKPFKNTARMLMSAIVGIIGGFLGIIPMIHAFDPTDMQDMITPAMILRWWGIYSVLASVTGYATISIFSRRMARDPSGGRS